jgi:mono/diheme cytochrome c family protein
MLFSALFVAVLWWGQAVPQNPGRPQLPAGDIQRGEAVFEGKGDCLSCHRVRDRGSRFGPDLTDIGARAGTNLGRGRGAVPALAPIPPDLGPLVRAQQALERSLVDPDADIAPQHRTVRVVTRAGETITARLLNQNTFTLQLIDTREQLRSIEKSDLREFSFFKTSPMPSYAAKLTPQELADVISYLISLKGINR